MSNVLYDAVITLGRAITNMGLYGVGVGDVRNYSQPSRPSCAIGHLSYVILGHPVYLADKVLEEGRETELSLTVLRALFDALPEKRQLQLVTIASHIDGETGNNRYGQNSVAAAMRRDATLVQYQHVVVIANDKLMKGDTGAVKQWFSDAFDLLAAHLPEPLIFEQLGALTAEPQRAPA